VASTVLSRMAVPVLYYLCKREHAAASGLVTMRRIRCRLADIASGDYQEKTMQDLSTVVEP